MKEGKLTWLLARLPEKKILDDEIDPYLCFSNSFDGKGAIRVCMTPVRVVCNNTLNFALDTAKRVWSTKHMGDMNSKLIEARCTLKMAGEYMDSLEDDANKLSDLKVSDAELEAIFDAMYPIDYNKDSNAKITHILDLKSNLFNCLNAKDISQYRGTGWSVAMAATDLADHGKPSRLTKNYDESRWSTIMFGHPFVDAIYKRLMDRVAVNE